MHIGPKPFTYDVLLSCGDDTRFGFTGFLGHSLNDRGFRTCINRREAVRDSKIFIPVLSKDYASSSARLDELVVIIDEFTKGNGRQILPVYYYVNPSDVRHQIGSFGETFTLLHTNCLMPESEGLDKHIEALRRVADFSGWHLEWAKDKYEYQYIEEILPEVSKHVACSIGLYHRVEKVMSYLYPGSDDGVCVVGICGVPGIGKTTVAHGVYHSIAGNGFDYCCIFDKVGLYLSKHGLVLLQQMLLSKIVGESTVFENVDEGMSIIKQTFSQKKIFLIFEDIDDSDHFKAIVELTACFGSGSKVIITTREKCLLEFHGIQRIYEVERLNKTEAFQLLSLKAFNSKNIKSSYLSILERAATHASGCPLSLEVIGSHLGRKRIEECESALDQYEIIPNHEIQKILKVSFDALGKYHQRMLTHIAFYLKDLELTVVELEDTLHSFYGVCPKRDIRLLLDKSLIKINELGRVTLHDLTWDMVRDNVPLEYPCKHSRLSKDILEENTEYRKQEIQPASNDGSMIWDPMELEYQVSYQFCSSSSSQDAL